MSTPQKSSAELIREYCDDIDRTNATSGRPTPESREATVRVGTGDLLGDLPDELDLQGQMLAELCDDADNVALGKLVITAASTIRRLNAQLDTERELRAAAEKNFCDLANFLEGVPPPTYSLHVKATAERVLAALARRDVDGRVPPF